MPLNVEIKARCADPDSVLALLREQGADYRGLDHQIDTYFDVPRGRLKLREGNIENNLIYYERPDQSGPKGSSFMLHPVTDAESLKGILAAAHGIKVVVDKRRHIFFIDNVKFHVDEVEGLGSFVEIEASDLDIELSKARLQEQCGRYCKQLHIDAADLIACSYSDLLLRETPGSSPR